MNIKQNLKYFLKEFILPGFLFVALASTVLGVAVPANAQTKDSYLNTIEKDIQLPSYNTNAHSNSSFESGASNITSAILYAVDFAKYVMGAIAVIIIIISGIRLITAARQIEEVSKKQKENLKYAIIGLIVIIATDQFVKAIYGDHGEVFRSEAELKTAATSASEQIRGIYTLIEYFASSLAVLMIIIAGFRLVTSAGNEDVQGKVKKQITWAVAGLIVMGLAEFVVKDVIFPKQGTTLSDVEKAKQLIVNFTNFVSGFIGTLAAIMYIYGGYLYVTTFGNEDGTAKAKKVFVGATIGLLLALGAFAIVTTTVKLEPTSGIEQPGSNAPPGLPTNP